EGVAQARPASLARHVLLGRAHAGNRIGDGAISGAAAKITLDRVRQTGVLSGIERRRGHDHAGRTEAALECLRIQERLLHRVQSAVHRQAFDRRHFVPGGTESGHQAGMHRRPVEPDGAGAAIAGVAALLDAEAAVLAQKGAQTLARFRSGFERALIDAEGERTGGLIYRARDVVHDSSARICSAKWYVRWRL